MNAPRKVVISRVDRDKVLREAILDDSKARVSLTGTRIAAPGARTVPEVAAKKVVISRADRDKVLREAILDDSKVRVYAVVAVANLPAPLNPYRCGHSGQFATFRARRQQRERWRRRLQALGQLRDLVLGRRRGRAADPTHVTGNEVARLAGRDFVDWLRTERPPACAWHWAATDWAAAARWATHCWHDEDLSWTEDAVRAWVHERVPAELRRATWSLIGDPMIWAGEPWDLANGQTRSLALIGSDAENVLVSRT